MAETDFILNRAEQNALLQYLLEQDIDFVPSLDYESNKFLILNSLMEISKAIDSQSLTGPFFLPFKMKKPYKFEMRSFKRSGKQFYYIIARQGSPCLDFSPCYYRNDYNPPLYTSGFIAYYPSYFWENCSIEIIVPEEVKDLYKRVNKYLRSVCKRYKTKGGKRSYLVGHKALEEFINGTAQNIFELDIDE